MSTLRVATESGTVNPFWSVDDLHEVEGLEGVVLIDIDRPGTDGG